jgi:hypothetical protein
MLGLYLSNAAFAFSYNVGDNHVFWLPAHACVALLIAPGIVALGFAPWLARAQRRRRRLRPFLAGGMIVYASTRAYYDFPALDRSVDRRPTAVLARLTDGLDDRRAIFLTELNWQLVNGLAYFGKVVRPNLAYAWLSHVLLYLPTLVRDNVAPGRDVVVSERARTIVATAYGPLLPTAVDSRVDIASLTDTVRGLPAGTRYVLCLLRPGREQTLDYDDVRAAIRLLTASTADLPLDSDYAALAGTAGRKPELAIASSQPFCRAASLDGVSVRIRMESWLEFDTIRRMGFGQVVAGRFHTLIVERGISFAAFDADGHPLRTAYRANIFAPERRYLVRLR